VREQLRLLDISDLSNRLSVTDPAAELELVIEQFNNLMQRVEASFVREQRFSSDVAHELRTPIAEIRNLAEVVSKWPQDGALKQNSLQEILQASINMQNTVNNLLALARCENRKLEYVSEAVDLSKTIKSAWLRVRSDAYNRQIRFMMLSDLNFICRTSTHELELILNNLFNNAIYYSTAGAIVTAEVTVKDGCAAFTLSNPADLLENSDLQSMFDRMWQKDISRSGEMHAGLGLSLVKAYTQILNLEIRVNLDTDNVFSITVDGFKKA
jgi:two-component system sensor histidine kinase QseC